MFRDSRSTLPNEIDHLDCFIEFLLFNPGTHVPRTTESFPRQSQRRFQSSGEAEGSQVNRRCCSYAKEHGHDFTADKITELSEEELEGVAGGRSLSKCVLLCMHGSL